MEKWEIRPPLPQKPLNRSLPKFACVVGNPYHYQKFHHDMIIPFRPQICENVHQVTRLVFCFFLQPTAKTHAPIFTISTSNDVSHKDVPFEGPTKFYIWTPFSPQNANFLASF